MIQVRQFLLSCLMVCLCAPVLGEGISLSPLFTKGAVLQREVKVPIWGFTTPKATVTVTFGKQKKTAFADSIGRWEVTLDPMPAESSGRTLTVLSGKERIDSHDIVVGEVWLLVGDHTYLNRFLKSGDTGKAGNNLRLTYILARRNSRAPQELPNMTFWKSIDVSLGLPTFFGQALQERVGVPVGIVVAATSAPIKPFISWAGLGGIPELDYLKPLVQEADPSTKLGHAAYARYREEVKDWLAVCQTNLQYGAPLPFAPEPPQADHPAFDTEANGEWDVGTSYNTLIAPLAPLATKGVLVCLGDYNVKFGMGGGYDYRIAFGPKTKAVLQSLRLQWKKPTWPVHFLGVSQRNPVGETMRGQQIEALQGIRECSVIDASNDIHKTARNAATILAARYYDVTVSEASGGLAKLPPADKRVEPAKGLGFDPSVFGTPSRGGKLAARKSLCAIRLPFIFSSNAVLQRNCPVPVWGWAIPNAKVRVSFAGQTKEATANGTGLWRVTLEPLKMSTKGRPLIVSSGKETLTYDNIVVGDVWLCSGQSNMAMKVSNCFNAKREIAEAMHPLIRQAEVKCGFSQVPLADVEMPGHAGIPWTACTPKTVVSYSATAYFFARNVHKETGVPIGIISSSLGGSRIEPWIAPEGLNAVPVLNEKLRTTSSGIETVVTKDAYELLFKRIEGWLTVFDSYIAKGIQPPPLPMLPEAPRTDYVSYSEPRPGYLYNACIHGLVPYAIKGMLWYQGESNSNEGETYLLKLHALIKGWRSVWGQGAFPVYLVQLPNHGAASASPAAGDGSAYLREAQLTATHEIPHTDLAVTIDIGEANDIHPKNKQDVGLRLAHLALHHDYGKTEVVPSGPLYERAQAEGTSIRIHFRNAEGGLMVGKKVRTDPVVEVKDGVLEEFAVAGNDGKWVPASAVIDGSTVVVSAESVAAPVAVRYAFCKNPSKANLYNRAGLPASPFRTDDGAGKAKK